MKSKFTFLVILTIFCNLQIVNAQNFRTPDGGGEFIFNESQTPCVTAEQRAQMSADIINGIEQLKLQNRLAFNEANRGGGHPLFSWPVQKAAGVTYNDVWAISGYFDHDLNFNNNLLDYNCGTKTYDTSNRNHEGVDIYTWPFSWKMMDDDAVEIIAAAPGQIIVKDDGAFDRSCNFSTTTPWNIVIVQHSDGSVAAYGHMKNGSTTIKNVGDMVVEGEYLGIVGSSGVSTGPHLHFEVLTDETFTQIIDPFFGSCNTITESWWADQKPYVNPKINAALTHTQAPNVFPPCPSTETPYESDEFETDDTIFFSVFLRDQTAGDIVTFEILRPDNSSLFNTWNLTAETTASSWYYYYGGYTGYFDMVGEWKWKVTFAGETVTHTFNVTAPLSVAENDFSQTSIFPNPFNNVVTISSNSKIQKATVSDVLGKTISVINTSSAEGIKEINLETLSKGLYFMTLEGDANQKKTIKLIKE